MAAGWSVCLLASMRNRRKRAFPSFQTVSKQFPKSGRRQGGVKREENKNRPERESVQDGIIQSAVPPELTVTRTALLSKLQQAPTCNAVRRSCILRQFSLPFPRLCSGMICLLAFCRFTPPTGSLKKRDQQTVSIKAF